MTIDDVLKASLGTLVDGSVVDPNDCLLLPPLSPPFSVVPGGFVLRCVILGLFASIGQELDRFDDPLCLHRGRYVVESGLCRARDPRFEALLMASYEATREGVRTTGSDQLISDVTDAIQAREESQDCAHAFEL